MKEVVESNSLREGTKASHEERRTSSQDEMVWLSWEGGCKEWGRVTVYSPGK